MNSATAEMAGAESAGFIAELAALLARITPSKAEAKEAAALIRISAQGIRRNGPCLQCGQPMKYGSDTWSLCCTHAAKGDAWLDDLIENWRRKPRFTRDHLSSTVRVNEKTEKIWGPYVCAACRASFQPEINRLKAEHQREYEVRFKLLSPEENIAEAQAVLADPGSAYRDVWDAICTVTTEERSEELRCMRYRDFLATQYWSIVRQRRMYLSRFSCDLCSSRGSLHVHHKTYEHHGYEHLWVEADLTTLCAGCHARFHGKLPAEPAQ
jgi:5-methylcytosine-specific restriction endonuclease McrA